MQASNTHSARAIASKNTVEHLADNAAAKADAALESSRKTTQQAIDTVQQGVEDLRRSVPGLLTRAATQVDELARQSVERAQAASAQVKDVVQRAGDNSRAYIRDEPVKSVLIAAATGAAVAALIGWAMSSRAKPH
jgi:ElaB/YqjD/DUF883 family membrane-anchored ribosome-binding protein